DINFHDRRKSKRSILARPCVVVLDLDSKVITKNCYDLGVGGLSLLFSKSENISFKDGQILNSCSIKISSGKIKGLKLRYLRTVQLAPYQYENYPFGGKRVSFSFHELSSSDLSKIEVFMEENDAFKIT
ncbi:MAG: hypothetical protein OEY33_04780, partial [Bdellovibrionales bacterium]|nr:hypothetical protein [Bdellovibrionales bacterium]